MQQFDLSLWLKDKSRKIVTRDGRVARIICCDAKNSKPIIALVLTRSISQREFDELIVSYFNDGTYYGRATEDSLDLFFADEEPETIEIPFGAKDSEFIKDEYFIPEGCEARIEGNKVIIEKIQKEEELTEFEQEIKNWMSEFLLGTEQSIPNKVVKQVTKEVLDLARKELEKDYCIMEPLDVSDLKKEQRELGEAIGRTNALKDLPKWKKYPSPHLEKGTGISVIKREGDNLNAQGEYIIFSHGWYILIEELEQKLLKEEE